MGSWSPILRRHLEHCGTGLRDVLPKGRGSLSIEPAILYLAWTEGGCGDTFQNFWDDCAQADHDHVARKGVLWRTISACSEQPLETEISAEGIWEGIQKAPATHAETKNLQIYL